MPLPASVPGFNFIIIFPTDLNKLICESAFVICRSGYSTIMELMASEKNASLVPTPGQAEQEYLAKYLSGKNCHDSADQSNFRFVIKSALRQQRFSVCDYERGY